MNFNNFKVKSKYYRNGVKIKLVFLCCTSNSSFFYNYANVIKIKQAISCHLLVYLPAKKTVWLFSLSVN